MTLYSILFYILAAVILASTAMAITRRDMVHAVIYLVVSFFGSALLFYLLGAPLLAALEIIIYAGAIMVLFLFIVMMIRIRPSAGRLLSRVQLLPAIVMSGLYVVVGAFMVTGDTAGRGDFQPAVAAPETLGQYVFQQHWVTVEIASLLLLVALVGAMIIGGKSPPESHPPVEEKS
ncbi:NADH-ubiquinone oxidoreductase chain J (EC [Olavius algarvensis associated proteobacterium Delta 3]|nr:NADH-ubiquinone oxidoreductase chain J (EC [Olavius algarvensis associated proteobacterium Delta 3]